MELTFQITHENIYIYIYIYIYYSGTKTINREKLSFIFNFLFGFYIKPQSEDSSYEEHYQKFANTDRIADRILLSVI